MHSPAASNARLAGDRERRLGLIAMVLLLAVIVALRGATLLFDHSLNSIDGAMQTWFALDNFAQGKQLGHAFQSYLGITMIVALLPVFCAFGQTLFASTFAAYAMVIAGSFASAYAIAWMFRPVRREQRWAVAVLLLFGFYYALRLAAEAVYYPYPATFEPGVSLRPLRGFLPFFVLPAFVMSARAVAYRQSALPALGFGLLAGAGLLWSNDAGIPLVIAGAVALALATVQQVGLMLKAFATYAVGVATSAMTILMLVTHGEPQGWLHYNFRDVAGDQFWYFAPWDPATRILSPADLPNILLQGEPLTIISLAVLIVCVIAATAMIVLRRWDGVRGPAFVFVGASVVGTALIPQLGGHIGSEYNAITFVLGICAPLILFQDKLVTHSRRLTSGLRPDLLRVGAATMGVAMVAIDAGGLALTASQTDRTVYVDRLGFYVKPGKAAELAAMKRLSSHWDALRIPDDRRLLSVYTSALDIAANTQSPQPVGSLIHALGSNNRSEFIGQVSKRSVAAVTTIAPDYSGWEGWILRANWPFSESLFAAYQPIARGDQHILWVPGPGSEPIEVAQCDIQPVSENSLEVQVRAKQAGLASVKVERDETFAKRRTAVLTVIEDSPVTRATTQPAWSDFPRYGIANDKILSLAAPVEPGVSTTLRLEVIDGSPIGTARCDAVVRKPINYQTLPSLSEGIDQYIARARP